MKDFGPELLKNTPSPRIGTRGRLRDFSSELPPTIIETSHRGLCKGLVCGDYRCTPPPTPHSPILSRYICFENLPEADVADSGEYKSLLLNKEAATNKELAMSLSWKKAFRIIWKLFH